MFKYNIDSHDRLGLQQLSSCNSLTNQIETDEPPAIAVCQPRLAAVGMAKALGQRLDGDNAMIFVTVGTHTPFDRLVRAVDDWAALEGREDVFAQIGATEHHPRHIAYQQFLTPYEYSKRLSSATLVIGHAGTGTLLTSFKYAKPLVVMPRHSRLRETRNDHQIAMAARFQEYPSIYVATDEQSLAAQIGRALSDLEHDLELSDFLAAAKRSVDGSASAELLTAIQKFITEE